ncbi:MAG: TraR/DksA family transcriptional regulator [Silicimonas sp.]|nr:TraR/DksA family transcriptional regulator [Silicimonas sp.]
MPEHDALIAGLKARRMELVQDLEKIEDTLDDEPPKDWEDRAAERQGDEVLEAMGQHDLEELRRIDAALARHAAGEYGACVQCGEDIAPARLNAVPDTPFCVKCAAQSGA